MKDIANPLIVNCFCDEEGKSGNPAGIYIEQVINDEERQSIAKRLNLPVTVFISNLKENIPLIEFFYPTRKMPLCLHGTLTAAYVLFGKFDRKTITLRTSIGKLLQLNKKTSNHFEIELCGEVIQQPLLPLMLCSQLLNIDTSEIAKDFPFAVASVGSPKLLIPISSLEVLSNLKPNFTEIEKWSLKNKVNGIYAYSHEEADIFRARGFNPMTGHNEDAATGVAAAALSLQLAKSIVVKQGAEIGVPCKIVVRFVNKNSIWVGGICAESYF